MKTMMEKLLGLLVKQGLRPNRESHRVGGRTSLRFYVDDHDDRYVDVEDSAESGDFVVVVRNLRDVESGVVGSPHDTVVMVRAELARLGEASKNG